MFFSGVSLQGFWVSVQGRGISVKGGLCFHPGGLCTGGGSLSRESLSRGFLLGRPPYGEERAVRILLESFLVQNAFPLLPFGKIFMLLTILD